ncbi:fatty-acid amide hydrolase 2-A-like isoform X2 [Atheta coriaria]
MSFLVVEYLLVIFFKLIYIIWYLPRVLMGMCRRKKVCVPLNDPPEIMQISGIELAKRIANKEVTCKFVFESYINRIKEVNPILNAVVEDRFEQALNEAVHLDEQIKTSDKTAEQWLEEFPLLGVPLTVKESIAVNGMSHTAGYFLAAGRRAKEDAEIIEPCRKAGAIIIAVTNTPELCLNWESHNNLIGTTNNPYDSRRTSGGSSGGEGALLGAGASVVGIGSDLGGSLRLPAHYCGVFSHKATAHVVSTVGHFPGCGDTEKWNSHFTLGPMCRYATDLLPMMRIVTKDEFKPTLNLTSEVDISKIKIYFLKNYGSILTSNLDPQISTGLDFLLDHFKIKYNLNVQPLERKFFKNSVIPALHALIQIKDVEFERPKGLFCGLLKMLFNCSNITLNTYIYLLLEKYGRSLPESTYIKCNNSLDELRNELETILGDDAVLIMPTFHRPADYHYTTMPRVLNTMNTLVFNSIGLPVTCCPIGFNSDGLPFGVQVISKRFNDRLSIAVAEEIENICGGWKMPRKK